ncbi:MAG: sirohydrochlorin chelatase [Jatrophihabitantaceae bacterium]
MPAATLLAVAHGTADPAGLAEIHRLVELVRTRRAEVPVELAWLERADPPAAAALGRLTGPVVVVPVLLSTGYHVKVDIRRLVSGRPETAIADQLGPDARLVEVLRQRLRTGRTPGTDVVLFGAGSSDPAAYRQLTDAAAGLRRSLGAAEGIAVVVHARFLTDPAWRAGLRPGLDVANYLLAPGLFDDRLRAHAEELAAGFVAPPIGAHPLLAELIWDRYDRAATGLAEPGLGSARPAPPG